MINNSTNRIGEKHITNEGYEIEIIEYFTNKDCTIEFKDGFRIYKTRYEHIKSGSIKNPYHKSVFNIGYLGEGEYTAYSNGDFSLSYKCWKNLLKRCYKGSQSHPSYNEVFVDEHWHNYQNFSKWFYKNYKDYMQRWQLDKDILFKSNKIYSPETCCFVPQEINLLFINRANFRGDNLIGVVKDKNKYVAKFCKNGSNIIIGRFNIEIEAFQAYKTAKESYIKEVANKWQDQITKEVYQAMYNYKVEIDD